MNRKKCTPLLCSQSIELSTIRVRVRPSFQVVSEASDASARVSARPSPAIMCTDVPSSLRKKSGEETSRRGRLYIGYSPARLNNNNFKVHHIYFPPPPQLPIRKFWLSCCFARSICKQ